MNTCKTCRHWHPVDPKVKHQNSTSNQRLCLKLNESSRHDGNSASVDDGYGQIETGPDFGCILHELQPEPIKPMPPGGYRCCS